MTAATTPLPMRTLTVSSLYREWGEPHSGYHKRRDYHSRTGQPCIDSTPADFSVKDKCRTTFDAGLSLYGHAFTSDGVFVFNFNAQFSRLYERTSTRASHRIGS